VIRDFPFSSEIQHRWWVVEREEEAAEKEMFCGGIGKVILENRHNACDKVSHPFCAFYNR